MADGDDKNDKPVVLNLLDDSVRSDTDAPSWTTGKLLASEGTRIGGEGPDGFENALLLPPIDSGKLLLRNSQDFDRVHHAL